MKFAFYVDLALSGIALKKNTVPGSAESIEVQKLVLSY